MTQRIHITGAAGAGVTTLGRALGSALAIPVFDTDDFFWLPTSPPFTEKRPVTRRLALMREIFLPRPAWVLSGSLDGWGDPLIPAFDLVVFLTLDPALRLARLNAREVLRYGAGALGEGGAEHAGHLAFMDWAAHYDRPGFTGRNRARHEGWLAALPCPVVTLDSAAPVEALVAQVLAHARSGAP